MDELGAVFASSVWDVIQGIGAVAGLLALGLSIYLGLRAAGVFEQPEYELTSSYLAPHDIIGFPTMPHFVLMYRNVGNVPVMFSDFELKYPRLDAVDNEGKFILTPGADLYIDKRLSSRLGGAQQYKKIDYRTSPSAFDKFGGYQRILKLARDTTPLPHLPTREDEIETVVLAHLAVHGKIKNADVQRLFGLSADNARRTLGRLRNPGVIELGSKSSTGRSVFYVRSAE
jgi:hypothetical protein